MKALCVVLLFIFFKNFVSKTKVKSVNKKNVTVVEITKTWSSGIRLSYNLIKGRSHSSAQFNRGFAVNYPLPPVIPRWSPSGVPKSEASESSDNFIYKTAYFKADYVDFFK